MVASIKEVFPAPGDAIRLSENTLAASNRRGFCSQAVVCAENFSTTEIQLVSSFTQWVIPARSELFGMFLLF